MRTEKLQLSEIRYNPESEAFEALVKIHDAGEVYTYPAQLRAPLQSDFAHIARGLTEKARAAHGAPQTGMRLKHFRTARTQSPRPAQRPVPRLDELPFMQMVLRKLAA